jgi:hypothetical protein
MKVIRLPTTLCVRRDPKFEVRGSKFLTLQPSAFSLQTASPVSPFALFSPWEPRYEQTD